MLFLIAIPKRGELIVMIFMSLKIFFINCGSKSIDKLQVYSLTLILLMKNLISKLLFNYLNLKEFKSLFSKYLFLVIFWFS